MQEKEKEKNLRNSSIRSKRKEIRDNLLRKHAIKDVLVSLLD